MVCFIFWNAPLWGVRVRLSLSLSLYRSLALVLALALTLSLSLSLALSLSFFLSVSLASCLWLWESVWARVPLTFFLPMAPFAPVFSERAVLWAHWNFLGLCFVLCLHISGFLCFRHLWMRMFVLIFKLWCANLKNAGISNMFALGRLSILAHCGLCLPHRKSNGNTARVIEDRHWKYNAHAH